MSFSIVELTKAKFLLKEVTIMSLVEAAGHGRIRLVYPKIKTDEALRAEAEAELKDIAAVENYTINPITGSVLINYNLAAIEKGSFLEALLKEARRIYTKGVQA